MANGNPEVRFLAIFQCGITFLPFLSSLFSSVSRSFNNLLTIQLIVMLASVLVWKSGD